MPEGEKGEKEGIGGEEGGAAPFGSGALAVDSGGINF